MSSTNPVEVESEETKDDSKEHMEIDSLREKIELIQTEKNFLLEEAARMKKKQSEEPEKLEEYEERINELQSNYVLIDRGMRTAQAIVRVLEAKRNGLYLETSFAEIEELQRETDLLNAELEKKRLEVEARIKSRQTDPNVDAGAAPDTEMPSTSQPVTSKSKKKGSKKKKKDISNDGRNLGNVQHFGTTDLSERNVTNANASLNNEILTERLGILLLDAPFSIDVKRELMFTLSLCPL